MTPKTLVFSPIIEILQNLGMELKHSCKKNRQHCKYEPPVVFDKRKYR